MTDTKTKQKSRSVQLAEKFIYDSNDGGVAIRHTYIDGETHYWCFHERICFTEYLWDKHLIQTAMRMFPDCETIPTVAKTAFKLITGHADRVNKPELYEILNDPDVGLEIFEDRSIKMSQDFRSWQLQNGGGNDQN